MMTNVFQTIEERSRIVSVTSISTNLIDSSPYQPRRYFDSDKLHVLAENIQKQGLLNAIIVRPQGHRYELIGGERRLRAIRDILEYSQVDAKIITCSDHDAAIAAAVDNARANLLPTERAQQVIILRDQAIPLEEIAIIMNYTSKSSVYRLIDVLDLPKEAQEKIDNGEIKLSHVAIIHDIKGEKNQIQAAELASKGKLNANQLKARTQHLPRRSAPREPSAPPPIKPEQLNQSLIRVQQDILRLPEIIWMDDKKILLMHIAHTQQALVKLEQRLRNS